MIGKVDALKQRLHVPRLYIETVRHLRRDQTAYLLACSARRFAAGLRLRRDTIWPVAIERLTPLRLALCADTTASDWACIARAESVLAGEFNFIGESRVIPCIRWGQRYGSPLWSFNLQYGEYIEDLACAHECTGDQRYLARLLALVDSWILQHKPVSSDAWAPYAVARRLLHWVRAFLICQSHLPSDFRTRWAKSIAAQTRYLAANVEWHLRANHVQKNLHAVYCAGALFDDGGAEALRRHAGRLLWTQVEEQVLSDGMHYERSPMYHAHFLADCREAAGLAGLLGDPLPADIHQRLDRMTHALSRFVRADGTLHLFNDAANDAARSVARLLPDNNASAPTGCWALPAAGYYGCATSTLRLIVDCGDPGPAYQPAHGHCDLLSFELDVDGAPLVVDSGTSGYDDDPLRSYVRSTRAHNTVQIADQEQHELWGAFRMARRARVLHAELDPSARSFVGSYSPYFSGRTVHRRSMVVRERQLWVEDAVTNVAGAVVRNFVHFHPDCRVRVDGSRIIVTSGARDAVIESRNVTKICIRRGETAPTQGWYAPEFGVRIPAPVAEMTVADTTLPFGYTIRCG